MEGPLNAKACHLEKPEAALIPLSLLVLFIKHYSLHRSYGDDIDRLIFLN
jgi:hypothetical protein